MLPLGLERAQHALMPAWPSHWQHLLTLFSVWEGALAVTGAVALALLWRQPAGDADSCLDRDWPRVWRGLLARVSRWLPGLFGAVLVLCPPMPWSARLAGLWLVVLVVTLVLQEAAQQA